jgi:hypothetical protein
MLLIRNGRVLDPATKTDAAQDILLDGEKSRRLARPERLPTQEMRNFSMRLD